MEKDLKKDLNCLISEVKEPIILRSFLKWNIFNWDLIKWKEILRDEDLEFRCGANAKTVEPQWERTTQKIQGEFKNLLELSDPKKWLYFDYKYLNQWCLKAEELRQSINFKDLGLDNVNANDSTIWMGTKGAHTPCHIDTYGSNVVIQLYGRKQWLLFPFKENLNPTRIPYEESSIYSKLNFFSPTNLSDFKGISNCKIVTLNPGDVLVVPHKWWHYVENLELSISINTWLPQPQDDQERQNECLVQMLIGLFMKDLNKEKQNIVLNPNFDHVIDLSFDSELELLNKLFKTSDPQDAVIGESCEFKLDYYLDHYKFINRIKDTSKEDLEVYLQHQSNRFYTEPNKHDQKEQICAEKLIHAVTHPDVIQLIMNKLSIKSCYRTYFYSNKNFNFPTTN